MTQMMEIEISPAEGSVHDRYMALERRQAGREALDRALCEIDRLAGNEIYQKAWKRAKIAVIKLRDIEYC